MRCSTGCLRVAARRSLPPAGGVDVLTADIKVAGCASVSRLGNRRARMRRWRRLVVPEARAAPRPRPWLLALRRSPQRPLGGCLGCFFVADGSRRLLLELNEFTRARLSGGCAARCSGCTCPRVPPFGRGPPRGDGGLVVVVPRGLRQQCRLGFSCLCPEPGYLSFSSSATTACASDTVADLKSWAVARRRT